MSYFAVSSGEMSQVDFFGQLNHLIIYLYSLHPFSIAAGMSDAPNAVCHTAYTERQTDYNGHQIKNL